jgi:CYTH domain-containing protein
MIATKTGMPIEIERKFLVKGDFRPFAVKKVQIEQGYLCATVERTVRVRIKDREAFITIKGQANGLGFSHAEYEYPLPYNDALKIIKLCETTIKKERYYIPAGKHTFEVDVFHGAQEGLVMAELELQAENETYQKPEWLGEEVTGDKRYYNAWMASNNV